MVVVVVAVVFVVFVFGVVCCFLFGVVCCLVFGVGCCSPQGFRAAYKMTRDRDVLAVRSILASTKSASSASLMGSKRGPRREGGGTGVGGMGGAKAVTIEVAEQRAEIKDPELHATLL